MRNLLKNVQQKLLQLISLIVESIKGRGFTSSQTGGNMVSTEFFKELAQKIATKFSLQQETIHENKVIGFKLPTFSQELCRLVYDESQQLIAISFQIQNIPTDAIQIYLYVMDTFHEILLLECFYRAANGQDYNGTDAQIMMEQDLQNKYLNVQEKQEQTEIAEAMSLKEQEKKGKITFH